MTEPVSLTEAKLNCRVDGDQEDALIGLWIVTGRRWVESYTGHILVPRDVTERLGYRRCLRAWPIATDAVVTLTYDDPSSIPTPLTGYRLNVGQRPAHLIAETGATAWPGAVSATVMAGYATPELVPAEMKTAILLIVKGLYDERLISETVERAAAALCWSHKTWTV